MTASALRSGVCFRTTTSTHTRTRSLATSPNVSMTSYRALLYEHSQTKSPGLMVMSMPNSKHGLTPTTQGFGGVQELRSGISSTTCRLVTASVCSPNRLQGDHHCPCSEETQKPFCVNDYRLVALTSTIMKCFEWLVS